jgi:uncharacterized lipoprotein YajG
MRLLFLLAIVVLLAGCAARKQDTDRIEHEHQQQMIRMG